MRLTSKQKSAFKERIETKVRISAQFIDHIAPGLKEYCKIKEILPHEEIYVQIYGADYCETCGERTKFRGSHVGFARFCSAKCRANSPEQIQQTKDRLCNADVQRRVRKTLRKNYGVSCPFASKTIQKRAKKTMLRKYGVSNPGQSDELQAARRQTMLDRYGVEHAES